MRYIAISIFLLISLITVFGESLDYYKILGVDKNADEKEIKKAYRNLSKIYHPDKESGDQNKFMEIGEAYEVLMDVEKRSVYDRYGSDALKNGGHQQHQHQQRHGGHHFDMFGDLFGDFFGGGGGGHHQQQRGKPRGRDVTTSMEFTLKEFFNGRNTDFSVELQEICHNCEGTGSKDGKVHDCTSCNGQGRVLMKRQLAPGMFQQFESACSKCNGSGKLITNHCKKCKGSGVIREEKLHNIHIIPGTIRNSIEKFNGEADKSPDWIAGDLNVIIKENKNEGNLGYRRIGNNLYRTEPISLKESIDGDWEREIPFLDNYDNTIKLNRKKGELISDGEIEIIKGKGMPIINSAYEFGDLFIEYKIIYPGGNKELMNKLHDEL
ncbi:hypothetical protein CANARDRAFT_30365 [[Candida] arabinofermentans NRRL YB-2248]|uniref:J domain-containing protein n=1 Tax=[Candida] arabinofermentans NRRL YB-2248 TaxID=983967 RepID=A0A1E4SU64_9ASCO|nr:hypothetical protein CANARDRAFT_30365 [[Candida] arabinofermentans NRRL YB-2248]